MSHTIRNLIYCIVRRGKIVKRLYEMFAFSIGKTTTNEIFLNPNEFFWFDIRYDMVVKWKYRNIF